MQLQQENYIRDGMADVPGTDDDQKIPYIPLSNTYLEALSVFLEPGINLIGRRIRVRFEINEWVTGLVKRQRLCSDIKEPPEVFVEWENEYESQWVGSKFLKDVEILDYKGEQYAVEDRKVRISSDKVSFHKGMSYHKDDDRLIVYGGDLYFTPGYWSKGCGDQSSLWCCNVNSWCNQEIILSRMQNEHRKFFGRPFDVP